MLVLTEQTSQQLSQCQLQALLDHLNFAHNISWQSHLQMVGKGPLQG